MKSDIRFQDAVEIYKKKFLNEKLFNKNLLQIENHVESLKDWSEIMSINELKKLFLKRKKQNKMKTKKINLKDTKNWIINKKTGNLNHLSKNFFSIQGIRVIGTKSREVSGRSWDQPFKDST